MSFVVFVSAGEIIVRLLEPTQNHNLFVARPGNPHLMNVPGAKGFFLGREVTINSAAYRGELKQKNKLSEFRILVFGDSHTFGIGVGDLDTYPAQLERYLIEKNYNVSILNMGIPDL